MPEPIPAPMQPPVIPMGSGKAAEVVAAVTRGGIQGGLGKFILDGLQTFDIWTPNPDQREWAIVALGMVVAAIQWAIEVANNRKLLGAAPTPATRDDAGLSQVGTVIAVAALTTIVVIALLKVFGLT